MKSKNPRYKQQRGFLYAKRSITYLHFHSFQFLVFMFNLFFFANKRSFG